MYPGSIQEHIERDEQIEARREEALLRAMAAGLDLLYDAMDIDEDPPCLCSYISEDRVDASGCPVHARQS
jgi:hypothetical protein